MPAAVTLDGSWQFRLDGSDRGLAAGWATGGPQDGWTRVRLPHVFDPRPRKSSFGGTVGWYRLQLHGPRRDPGLSVGHPLRAGPARSRRPGSTAVPLGTNRDPYVPFTPARAGRSGPGREHARRARWTTARARSRARAGGTGAASTRPASLVPLGRWHRATRASCRGAVRPAAAGTAGGASCSTAVVVNRSGAAQPDASVAVALTPPGRRRSRRSGATAARARWPPASRHACASRSRSTAPTRTVGPGSPALYGATHRHRAGRPAASAGRPRAHRAARP